MTEELMTTVQTSFNDIGIQIIKYIIIAAVCAIPFIFLNAKLKKKEKEKKNKAEEERIARAVKKAMQERDQEKIKDINQYR